MLFESSNCAENLTSRKYLNVKMAFADLVCRTNRENTGRREKNLYKMRCCAVGKKLAKHGYIECKWSLNLIRNIDRIDRQWKRKSPVTGALPSKSLINVRRLRKCKQHKYIFNKCCEAEKVYNEMFIKVMLKRQRQMSARLRNKMYDDYYFNKEVEKQLTS